MTSAMRGEGVPSKADIVSNLSKGGCVNLRTRGGGGPKIPNFADVICVSPLILKLLWHKTKPTPLDTWLEKI